MLACAMDQLSRVPSGTESSRGASVGGAWGEQEKGVGASREQLGRVQDPETEGGEGRWGSNIEIDSDTTPDGDTSSTLAWALCRSSPAAPSPTPEVSSHSTPSAPTSLLHSLLSVLISAMPEEGTLQAQPLGTPWAVSLGPEALSTLQTALGGPLKEAAGAVRQWLAEWVWRLESLQRLLSRLSPAHPPLPLAPHHQQQQLVLGQRAGQKVSGARGGGTPGAGAKGLSGPGIASPVAWSWDDVMAWMRAPPSDLINV